MSKPSIISSNDKDIRNISKKSKDSRSPKNKCKLVGEANKVRDSSVIIKSIKVSETG